MKKKVSFLKKSDIFFFDNNYYQVLDANHVKPGKNVAFIRCLTKNIHSQIKKTYKFHSNESVEFPEIEKKDFYFSYQENEKYIFVNKDDLNYIEINKNQIKNILHFLQCKDICFHFYFDQEKVILIKLPEKIAVKVIQADPCIKNSGATPSYKNIFISPSLKIKSPMHIKENDKIIINTQSLTYVEKANE